MVMMTIHASVIWKSERRLRVTSTSVKAIFQWRATTAVTPLVKQMVYTATFKVAQLSDMEYLQWLRTNGSVEASVDRNCGLIVLPTYPWLAATLDGLVIDPSASSLAPEGIVEFKNPYIYMENSLQEAIGNEKCSCLINAEGRFH